MDTRPKKRRMQLPLTVLPATGNARTQEGRVISDENLEGKANGIISSRDELKVAEDADAIVSRQSDAERENMLLKAQQITILKLLANQQRLIVAQGQAIGVLKEKIADLTARMQRLEQDKRGLSTDQTNFGPQSSTFFI